MFEPIPFSRVSYDEIPAILADKSQSDIEMDELKFILSPVYNSGIEFDNVYYCKLDNIDEFNSLEDKSYIFKYIKKYGEELSASNPEDLVIVFSSSFDNESENLYQRAHDLNWNMIADESTDIESGVIFMYVFTEKQTAIYKAIEKNLIEIAHAEGLISEEEYTKDMTDEEKSEYLKQNGDSPVIYYVSYGIMGDKGLENIVISLKGYISDINDIAAVRSVIAKNKNVDDNKIFIFGFSIFGNPSTEESEMEDIEDYNEEYDNQDTIGPKLGFFCNRITYRINGEERVYDSWQNIDLCSDEKTTEHFAKSIIANQEGLTEEELANVEIIDVELLSSGTFGEYPNIDDEDEEED